jgi:hypothetical protein
MQSVPPLPAWAVLTPIARSRSSAALSRPVPIPRPWCPGVTSTSGLLPARSTAAKPTARPSSTAPSPGSPSGATPGEPLVLGGEAESIGLGFSGWQVEAKRARHGCLTAPSTISEGDLIGARPSRSSVAVAVCCHGSTSASTRKRDGYGLRD